MDENHSIADEIQSHLALVTGAGSGLGRALCLELTKRGLRVAGLGRRVDALQEVARAAQDHPGQFFAVGVDVADNTALQPRISDLVATEGPIGLLINNAAIYPRRDILDETPESFMATLAINTGGVFNCAHAVLPGMIELGFGRIINIGSFADLFPAPASAAYSVSKGAARILTRAMVADLGDRFPDIIVNDWMPGVLNTEMGRADGIDPAQAAVWGANLALWHDRSLNGCIFERQFETLPPVSFKRRLFQKITGSAPQPRRLDQKVTA